MAYALHILRGIGLLASLWALPVHAWNGKQDNKPIAELERMVEGELAYEASIVCRDAAATAPASGNVTTIQKDALAYINTISRYGRRLNRGTTPWWSIAMYKAIQAGDGTQCEAIWQKVVK